MKKQLLYFFLFISFASFTTSSAQTPIITSFTPLSAKPGDVVTIIGSNFNSVEANNVVIFGATRAVVNTASTTALTVTVPISATYAPITVLNLISGLAVSSATNFNPIYSPVKINITQTDFQPKQDFRVGDAPYTVAIGDLDGDGKPDLVVVNVASNTISVLRNTSSSGSLASGSFAAKIDFVTGDLPYALNLNDLDGDGKLDIIIANRSANTISVYHNTSSIGSITASSFNLKVDFAVGDSPSSIAIGDLDGDGKVDIATANVNSNSISVLHNTSVLGSLTSSSFATKVDFLTALNPQTVAMGDLDGDSKIDLVSANLTTNNISVFLNTSNPGNLNAGSFATKADFITGNSPIALIIGDLDTDGKSEIATANFDSNSISILKNTSTIGNASFANKVDFITGTSPQSINIGDLDGDGKPDLVVANASDNSISFFRNIGIGNLSVGSFAAKIDFVAGERPTSASIGDLDGDGRPDLAVTNSGSRFVSVMRNVLPPTITSFNPAYAKPGDVVSLIGTNFNTTLANNVVYFGATKAIVTAATTTSLTVTVPKGATYAPIYILNKSTTLAAYSSSNFMPIYSPAKTTVTINDFQPKKDYTTGDNPQFVAIGDLDGDGKSDLAIANQTSNTVSLFLNTSINGVINLAAKIDIATGTTPRSIAIGDINGDGRVDLAITNQASNTVSVLINTSSNGIISFASKVDFTTGIMPVSIAIGDIDLDGKPDLIIANEGSNTVSILRNAGNGGVTNFETKADYPTGANPYGIVVGDINGDGLLDVAVTNFNDNTVSILGNTSVNGNLSFVAKLDFATGNSPSSIAIGDLDGDSKPDLAIVNSSSGSASVLRNTSNGSIFNFATKVDFSSGLEPKSIAIGDINGDEKPDLVIGNVNAGTYILSVLRNTSAIGALSFLPNVDFATNDSPWSIAIADMDGDGKSDMVSANSNSNTVSILRNIYEPVIQASGNLSALNSIYGTASASTSFTVSGMAMQGAILITPPLGFELSTNNSEFSSTLNLGTGGDLTATTIYLRLKSTTVVGNYGGDITLTSFNAVTVNIPTMNSTIIGKPLIVTANNFNKIYDGQSSTSNNGVTYLGFVNGDDEKNLQGILTYSGTAIGAKEVGTYVISAIGLTSVNYIINYQDGNLKIVKALVKISANPQSKVYGNTDPTLTYTSTGLIGTDVISGALSREVGEQVGNYVINQGSLDAGVNYAITYTGADLTIGKALLTITANNKSICLTKDFPVFTVSYAGFKNNDNENSLTAKPQVNTTANNNSPIGTYLITASAANSNNYTFSYVDGTLTISPLPTVAITSSKGNNISKGETLTLTATGGASYFWANASGVISGQNSATLNIRPNLNTTYTVTATNANGCSQTSSITIEVRDDVQAVKANNILTPNGDGVNDMWEVANIDVFPNNLVQVYDRSGRLLFTKKGYNNSWDGTVNGKQLAEGTYYYLIDFGPDKPKQKGFITLIR